MIRLFPQFLILLIGLAIFSGCEESPPPGFRFNIVEWTNQEQTQLSDGEHFDESYKTEIGSILTTLFGTPDEPDFPFFYEDEDPAHDIISLEKLKMAAGPVANGNTTGLYRLHCAHCHGVTGDGAGPTALQLNPYPRDFRVGKFKFKSTPLRQAPTDHDLTTILENGIPGTAMPSFRTLPAEEIEALVQYVKYLTIRGQFERYLIGEVATMQSDEMPFLDFSLIAESKDGKPPSDDDVEEFEDQIYVIFQEGFSDVILNRWLKPDKRITKIPPAPAEFSLTDPGHQEFVNLGRELFFAKGNCMQCHGDTGVGDGQLNTYDDWTNDWYKAASVSPETYQSFLDIGALPARPIRPRNLHLSIFRGGSHPDDLYLRLVNGIEGTPMPASSAMAPEQIWAVVAYVKSLPFADDKPTSLPVNEQQVAK